MHLSNLGYEHTEDMPITTVAGTLAQSYTEVRGGEAGAKLGIKDLEV